MITEYPTGAAFWEDNCGFLNTNPYLSVFFKLDCPYLTQTDIKITNVYTRDAYRGKGCARKVVNTMKNEILAAGKTATLNVDRNNPITCHLYTSLGFKRIFSQGEFRRIN